MRHVLYKPCMNAVKAAVSEQTEGSLPDMLVICWSLNCFKLCFAKRIGQHSGQGTFKAHACFLSFLQETKTGCYRRTIILLPDILNMDKNVMRSLKSIWGEISTLSIRATDYQGRSDNQGIVYILVCISYRH